jgi:uncharacterized RDD family membrane protein YckC
VIPVQHVSPDRDLKLQGHYAGITSRLAGFVIDMLAIVIIFNLLGSVSQFLVTTLTDHSFRISELPVLPWLLLAIGAFLYLTYPVAATGKTLGLAMVGLRVVSADGSYVSPYGAVVRVLALPLSFVILCYGFIMILVDSDHRALHDRIGGTAVVYDWDASAARIRFMADRRPSGAVETPGVSEAKAG